jgi:hypothetical protein
MTMQLPIQPIKLLKGSHDDTGKTGSGCFMNVIAYLNGEPVITDQSECVCVVVRPLAIWLNDFADDAQRQQLLPFIERAMGSATRDKTELVRRAWLAVDFANEMKEIAAYAAARAAHAARAAAYAAAARAADAAAYAAADAAAYAVAAAADAADAAAAAAAAAADAAARKRIFEAGIRFLDAALPKAVIVEPLVQSRALCLVATAEEATHE